MGPAMGPHENVVIFAEQQIRNRRMTPEPLYPRFSEAEFARRHKAARALMAAEDVDALIVFGNSGIARHNHAEIHYLSGFLGNRNNYLVMTKSGEPVLFVQSHNHVPNAREASS